MSFLDQKLRHNSLYSKDRSPMIQTVMAEWSPTRKSSPSGLSGRVLFAAYEDALRCRDQRSDGFVMG